MLKFEWKWASKRDIRIRWEWGISRNGDVFNVEKYFLLFLFENVIWNVFFQRKTLLLGSRTIIKQIIEKYVISIRIITEFLYFSLNNYFFQL